MTDPDFNFSEIPTQDEPVNIEIDPSNFNIEIEDVELDTQNEDLKNNLTLNRLSLIEEEED